MFGRTTTSLAGKSTATMASRTPMEDLIREKLATTLSPLRLDIHNDSHLHAHHAAMRDLHAPATNTKATKQRLETHFRVLVVSDAFADMKNQPARHRLVYGLLRQEMAREGGIHALQLQTRTPEEERRQRKED